MNFRGVGNFALVFGIRLTILLAFSVFASELAYALPTPTLTVATSVTPSTYGASVKFTATISSGPTGTITFYDGGTSIGTGTISGGKATYSTTSLTAGTHSITASWPGSSSYNPVTSSAINQVVNMATPTITWSNPSAITYGTALSSTQLDASTTPAGTFAYSPAVGTVLNAGSQTLSVTFTPTDSTDYNTASKNVSLTVNKATPTLGVATSGTPSTYGSAVTFTATISSGPTGTITFYSGSSSIGTGTISGTTATDTTAVVTAGSHTITAKWAGNSNYNSVTSSGITQTVSKATPVITWTTPSAITYGAALSATQLNATANVSGSFSYNPALGTVLSPGSQTLSTTFTPTDTTDYSTVTATVTLTVSAIPGQGIITTIAGNGYYGYSGDGGPAIAAMMSDSVAVVVDTVGNVYLLDQKNYVVRKVAATTGIITTVAGNGTQTDSGDGGPATSAGLSYPDGLAIDSNNNLYIAVEERVRKVTASTGIITTVAGNGIVGHSGDGGPATSAEIVPGGNVAVDPAGNIYIPDEFNAVVRAVSAATGIITTIAGDGNIGYSGDGGSATSAELDRPSEVAVDLTGHLYILDSGAYVIREVTLATGIITTAVGNGTAGYSGDGGPATSAEINPGGIAVDSVGNICLSDSNNEVIRVIAASTGTISTVAGNGNYGYAGDGGPAIDAEFEWPSGVGIDSSGDIYIPDFFNVRIREVGLIMSPFIKATPVVTWATPAAISYGTALSATQLDATANVAGTFVYSPAAGAVLTAGSQTLSVTFTPSNTTDYNTVTASVTLLVNQPIAVSVAPTTATLSGGQTQQFAATVTNTSNTGVTWSISPSGVGAISASGLYTAPASVAAQQTVTVIATSQADSTKSASSTIDLLPFCGSNGYEYERSIVIDATKVPYADQVNFPFLFSTTDPLLKSTSNGGHVSSPSGYDIIFTSDAAGNNILPFEQETYDAATGQATYWIQDTLSHTQNTVIYMWYGNLSVTTSQAQPAAVWDSNYQGVWHFPNGTTLSANDSTANGHNGTDHGAIATTGIIDGGASFNGSSYIDIGNMGNFPTQGTIEFWMQPSSISNYPNALTTNNNGGNNGIRFEENSNAQFGVAIGNESFNGYSLISGMQAGTWYPVAVSWNTALSSVTGYVNGAQVFSTSSNNLWPSTMPDLAIGIGYDATRYWNGSIDEARVSTTSRSADWIATEYNNESSPSTFYAFSSENALIVNPGGVSLTGSESVRFAATSQSNCSLEVAWSISPSGVGSISAGGLYTAPSSISSPQTVTVTATNQQNTSETGTAIVSLVPQTPALTLSPVTNSPYATGTTQGFVATMSYPNGTPAPGIPVEFNVVGSNPITGVGVTDATGTVSFTYAGTNNGTDTITASGSFRGTSVISNSISVSWIPPTLSNSEGSVSILDQPSIGLEGLVGAFTDNIGSVIEPIAIGAAPRVFVVPPGATQLQLGIDDGYNVDNWGPGFVVDVNDVAVTVPAGAMPWLFVPGGLNSGYAFGVQDGTIPVVAATHLIAGQNVVVAYQSGLNSPGGPYSDIYDANGVPSVITGTSVGSNGLLNPTYYMSGTSYPVGQPVSVTAIVMNAAGAPMVNVPVILKVTGANSRELEAATNAGGSAAFTYTGLVAGTDILKAEAIPSGEATLESSQSTITWVSPTSLSTGTLTLSPTSVQPQPLGGAVTFTVYATDSFGAPVSGLNLGLVISGSDQMLYYGTTDATGHATIVYQGVNPGTASVEAVSTINNLDTFSNVVSVPWTLPSSPTNGSGSQGTLSVVVSSANTVTLPSTLQLTGTVSDTSLPQGDTITTAWTQVSGPGTATFSPQQPSTTASFSEPGTYVLQLSASDVNGNAAAQLTVKVDPIPGVVQGWIGSPTYGSAVSCFVPITVASGESLVSGTLTYYPANNPDNFTVLNSNTTGSGQIGTLDTTMLSNGTYMITLQATDTNGNSSYNLALVTVVGNCKPGRVTSTVTDLVVPAKGLSINIQRTYDSLNAGTIGDFGYGWNLGTNVNLTLDTKGDVTFTLGGLRKTFDLTPQNSGFLPFDSVVFTPEPGLHGTLTDSASGCADLFDYVVPDGNLWACVGGGYYNPPGYIYTDPSGTSYTMSANGNLQSVVDKNGNALTITSAGITSSTGLSVPFVRDSSGRITSISDPQGNVYQYSYDTNGNLESVAYPSISTQSTYTYFTGTHLYESGTDFRGNTLPTTDYYQSTTGSGGECQGDCDPNGLPLNGRLKSVTTSPSPGVTYTTTYAYNLLTNTTTVSYPADANGNVGTATMVDDPLGDVLTSTDPLGHTTTNVYDPNQDLISVTDPLGNVSTYTYDSNGNKTSSTYPATATSTNTTSITAYNQYSEPTSTTDELGNTRTFNYDANFNPLNVTDNMGTLASFSFNADGTMQAGAVGFDISAQPSNASQFAYDSNGNLICRTDALGRPTSYSYDTLGHKISMSEPLQNQTACVAPGNSDSGTTSYTYDDFGNLTQTTAPLSRVTSSQYDGNGNKTSDTDARGHTTTYAYDALNRLILTTYPDSTTASKTYDFRGNVVTQTDQAGHVTKNVYDLAGRLTSVTQAYGTSSATITSYTYDNAGRKLSQTDNLSHTTSYTYDAAGNLTGVSGVGGAFTYTYDNARNRVSMTDGKGNTTSYQYDARKRLVETDYPDGTKTTNTYDGPGNLIKVIDQAEHEVDYAYDAANQLQTVTQPNSPNAPADTTIVGYDANGNPITLEDANMHTTASSFDLVGELTGKTLPDGALSESRTYDNNGNLSTVTHFNGVVTTYTYDNLNRLLSRATPGETTVSLTYTATGKRQTMTDASGTTTYGYDSMDRLTSKATPEGTLSYTYDAAGHVASVVSSNSNGASASYTYDNLNRLSTVVDTHLGTTSYSYDEASNVATVTYPNGVESQFTYDTLNRVTGLSSATDGYTYQRGATGNLTSVTESSNRAVTWNYDGIDRLTSESIASAPSGKNGTLSYGLDPVGNRSSASSSISGLSPVSGTFNQDDELTSAESYDNNGNVTATGGKTFAYDAENHLISMGSTVALVYDGDGNRVAKTVSGVTTRYLVDDLNPTDYSQVMDELTSGSVTRTYTYGLERISEDQVISDTWTPSFYGYDGGGNVRQLTNTSGAVTDTYDYDAFGNKINSTGSTPNNFLYRGEQLDSDLGLYYLRARWMNPLTGRFMSRDPESGNSAVPKTLHKYLYASADPVNRIDPLGREAYEEYQLTLICGGSVYCGPAITWTGIKIAAAWALIGTELWESFDFATNPEAPPPPVHDPTKEPGGPENPPEQPPISGPPVAGAP